MRSDPRDATCFRTLATTTMSANFGTAGNARSFRAHVHKRLHLDMQPCPPPKAVFLTRGNDVAIRPYARLTPPPPPAGPFHCDRAAGQRACHAALGSLRVPDIASGRGGGGGLGVRRVPGDGPKTRPTWLPSCGSAASTPSPRRACPDRARPMSRYVGHAWPRSKLGEQSVYMLTATPVVVPMLHGGMIGMSLCRVGPRGVEPLVPVIESGAFHNRVGHGRILLHGRP